MTPQVPRDDEHLVELLEQSLTPYQEDMPIQDAAVYTGYHDVHRRPIINIDAKALPPEWFRRTPDYRAIRRALEDGQTIPGAKLTNEVEYVLRKPRAEE